MVTLTDAYAQDQQQFALIWSKVLNGDEDGDRWGPVRQLIHRLHSDA